MTMKSFRKELWFNLPTRRGFVNITSQVEACLQESGIHEGFCLVNTKTTRRRQEPVNKNEQTPRKCGCFYVNIINQLFLNTYYRTKDFIGAIVSVLSPP